MSIIETFYVLFKSNSADVKKSFEEVKKSSDDIEKKLNKLQEASGKIGDSFLNTTKSLVGFLAAAASIYTVIRGFKEATDYVIELGNISRQLGVSVTDLDAWGNAVQRAGGTAAGFQSSLKNLTQHLGGNAQVALKVLPQLADTFERIGRARSTQYGKMLGLDEGTILLLQQGRREVEAVIARQRELGLITKENALTALKFNNALTDTGHAFRSLYIALGTTVLPVLTKIFDALIPVVQYLQKHTDLIWGAVIAIGAVAAVIAAPFIAANAVVIGLVAGIAALSAAFAIAYEDVKAFLDGNNSLIGDILKKWPIVGEIVNGVIKSWKLSFDLLFAPLKLWLSLFEKASSFFNGDTKKLSMDIQNGQNLLGAAGASYLNSQTSTSIFGGNTSSRNNNVTTGPITINTQATDATGIAGALGRGLNFNNQMQQSNSNFDDGVLM